jgi:predicted nucleotidyltransferase
MTTEPPPLDVERILATLTQHGVEFLLVGGVAAIAHGARRLTVDLDCVPVRTYENLDRYDDLDRRANEQPLHGITVRVAALDDIISSKEWADRPKDRDALAELRRLAAGDSRSKAARTQVNGP